MTSDPTRGKEAAAAHIKQVAERSRSASSAGGASCRSASSSSSSPPTLSATRATRAATCATPSSTTGRPRSTTPWGKFTRWKLFDLPWDSGTTQDAKHLPRGALIGQEQVQAEIYRALSNFVREGRPNRLVLLHGPNGSAKSTIVGVPDGARSSTTRRSTKARSTASTGSSRRTRRCAARSASAQRERRAADDARTRTSPTTRSTRSSSSRSATTRSSSSRCPSAARSSRSSSGRTRRSRRAPGAGREPPNDWILRGQLSHKSQQVFEALLASYHGSYTEVLKHVQVERYFISQRYRVGAVTIGPQISVDAAERQITADRSLAVAPGVAPGDHALRGEGGARRGGGRAPRVQRSAQAPARRLQVPPALDRDGRGRARRSRTCSSTAS